VFAITTAEQRETLLARLRADPEVESAQALQTFSVRTDPQQSSGTYDDPYVGLQPGLAAMDIAGAHRRSRGEKVRIAIVDTGIDAGHPELAGRIAEYVNLVDDTAPTPVEAHGTAVAGVIAAAANNGEGIVGVAPSAQLLVLRACWQSAAAQAGDAATCNSFTLARALARAIEDRASVINLSLAGPDDALLARLLGRAIERGAIVVGATVEDPASTERFPAAVPGVIAVRSAEWPDAGSGVCAPGRNVLTLQPQGRYDFENGSSLAAAQISGIVALLRARNPRLRPAQALALLEKSHGPQGAPVCLVNACSALAQMLDGVACDNDPGRRALARVQDR
jgi:subtilisin family serine protease